MKLLLMVFAGLLFFYNVQAQDKNFIDQNYIEVTGISEIELVPDEIYVKVVISESDNKAKVSLEELERKMIDKLEEIGVDVEEDLSILDFTSNFKEYWLKKDDIFTAKEYQIIAHEGRIVGRIFQELEKLGISNINITKLDHSKIEEYRREVKVQAVKAAKNKAIAMGEAIGQNIGKAIYIQEIEYGYPGPMVREVSNYAMRVEYDSKMKEPEIEFEKIKLEYRVLTRFALD